MMSKKKVIQIKENEPITFPTEVQKPNDFETLPHEGQTELISSLKFMETVTYELF